MDSYNNRDALGASSQTPRLLGIELTARRSFVLGLVAGLAALYFGVARPTADQVRELRSEIGSLHNSIRRLAELEPAVGEANGLLAMLTEQQERTRSAELSFRRVASLNEQLVRQAANTSEALSALEQLADLKDDLRNTATGLAEARTALTAIRELHLDLARGQDQTAEGQAALASLGRLRDAAIEIQQGMADAQNSLERMADFQQHALEQADSAIAAQKSLESLIHLKQTAVDEAPQLAAAQAALTALADLKSRVLSQKADLDRVREVVDDWTQMQQRLADSAVQSSQARTTGEELLDLAADLERRGDVGPAREALDGLSGIRERLEGEGANVDAAEDRLGGLLALKDKVLAQTENLAEAVETLELVTDLGSEIEQAAQAIGRMRSSIVEVILLEPTIRQAVSSLQPITELANLRRLSGNDLRAVVRQLQDRRAAELAAKREAGATTDAPVSSSAALPVSAQRTSAQ